MSRHQRTLTLAVLILLISPLAHQLIPSTLPSIPRVHAANRTIFLTGTYPTWNSTSPTITVTQGDTITMMLSSRDGLPHRFLVDVDNDPMNPPDVADCPSVDPCSSQFDPTTSTSYTFTVNFPIGSYKYICTIHYPAMVGNFIVQPPPDFGVSSNPSSLTVLQGSNANSTITVSSIGNFAGSITLSAASSPSGPTTSFNVNPVMVPAGGTASSKLTISILSSVSTGSYSVTVTARNSTTFSRTTTVSVSVISPSSDFTISSSPTSLNIAQGSSGTATITLTSVNGYSNTLSLTPTVSANGPQVSLSPTSLTLSSGGTASATLTAKTASSGLYSSPVSQGTYNVNVTATDGTLSRSATLTITVGSTSPSGAGNLLTPLLIGVIAAAAAILIVAVVYLLRRKPKTQPQPRASAS